MIDCDDCGEISEMNEWQEKHKYLEEICSNSALVTTDHTWIDSGSSPGLHGGKPVTNCLSYSTAKETILTLVILKAFGMQ
jgi:hypothetical protein